MGQSARGLYLYLADAVAARELWIGLDVTDGKSSRPVRCKPRWHVRADETVRTPVGLRPHAALCGSACRLVAAAAYTCSLAAFGAPLTSRRTVPEPTSPH